MDMCPTNTFKKKKKPDWPETNMCVWSKKSSLFTISNINQMIQKACEILFSSCYVCYMASQGGHVLYVSSPKYLFFVLCLLHGFTRRSCSVRQQPKISKSRIIMTRTYYWEQKSISVEFLQNCWFHTTFIILLRR